jgi:hypothetical protein
LIRSFSANDHLLWKKLKFTRLVSCSSNFEGMTGAFTFDCINIGRPARIGQVRKLTGIFPSQIKELPPVLDYLPGGRFDQFDCLILNVIGWVVECDVGHRQDCCPLGISVFSLPVGNRGHIFEGIDCNLDLGLRSRSRVFFANITVRSGHIFL